MFKCLPFVAVLLLLAGCATTAVHHEADSPAFSAEATQFLHEAEAAIAAYQAQDKATWERLVCQQPSSHALEHDQQLIGTYEDVRLVAVKDKSPAANKPPHQQFIEIVFEGSASNYPMPGHRMALTFTDIGQGCLYLTI